MTERDELIHLKLRQARRAERPYNLLKAIFIFGIVLMVCVVLQNCSDTKDPVRPLTQAQIKQNTDALWGGHAEARKRRLP